VAQEIRETVFEPLVTTKAKGIGLGLTICREILEHHGGGIELIDEGKPGAAFRIRLPR
jgi:signal transduction histidine kinase